MHNLTEHVLCLTEHIHVYAKNFKMLIKKIKEDPDPWKEILS